MILRTTIGGIELDTRSLEGSSSGYMGVYKGCLGIIWGMILYRDRKTWTMKWRLGLYSGYRGHHFML